MCRRETRERALKLLKVLKPSLGLHADRATQEPAAGSIGRTAEESAARPGRTLIRQPNVFEPLLPGENQRFRAGTQTATSMRLVRGRRTPAGGG
jgi:hypothetical protein